MSYLKHKPGSIEELMANEASKLNDNAYQDMFKKELDKAGKGIGGMSPKEKKDFFNKIDSKYKAKNEAKVDELTKAQEKLPPALQKAIKDKETKKEGFASDAQRKAAFASGYKEKDKKEETVKKEGGPGSGPQGGDSYKTGHKKSVMKPGAGKRPGSAKDGGQTDKEADDYDNEMGEALGKEDDSIVKAVVSQLKKAVKAHDGQAKDLEKAMKNEADQHGDEINDKKKEASKKGEKEPQKLNADSGSKLTKVETEPKVDYKN